MVETLRKRFGDLVLRSVVRQNVSLAEAPAANKPITLYAPRSIGAEDYRAVAQEIDAIKPAVAGNKRRAVAS